MLLDIVILPPPSLREKIGAKMRQTAKGRKYIFVVDNRKLIPHMSLFHIRTSRARLKKLKEIVGKISKRYRPVVIRSTGFIREGRIVAYELSHNQTLRGLNREIVKNCYNLRTGMMPWTGVGKPKRWEQKNREKYGTQHNIGPSFRPHFTMGKFKSEVDVRKVARQMQSFSFQFQADTVAICEVNFWHQVTRIYKKFILRR